MVTVANLVVFRSCSVHEVTKTPAKGTARELQTNKQTQPSDDERSKDSRCYKHENPLLEKRTILEYTIHTYMDKKRKELHINIQENILNSKSIRFLV